MKKIKNILKLMLIGVCILISVKIPNNFNSYLRNKTGLVIITSPEGDELGTGFHIKSPLSGEYYILTNRHVCNAAWHDRNVHIIHEDNILNRKILKYSLTSDLCLIEKIFDKGVETISEGNDFYLYSIGYGGGIYPRIKYGYKIKNHLQQHCITNNIRSCDNRFKYLEKTDLLYMRVIPGDSGSPVLNIYGELTSVVYYTYGDNMSGSVNLENIKDFFIGF